MYSYTNWLNYKNKKPGITLPGLTPPNTLYIFSCTGLCSTAYAAKTLIVKMTHSTSVIIHAAAIYCLCLPILESPFFMSLRNL